MWGWWAGKWCRGESCVEVGWSCFLGVVCEQNGLKYWFVDIFVLLRCRIRVFAML